MAITSFILLFICFSLMVFRYPVVAISIMFCMFGFEQLVQSLSSYFVQYNSLINFVVALIFALGLVVKFFDKKYILRNYPGIGFFVLVLFAYSFISIFWSPIPDISYELWYQQLPYLILYILLSSLLFSSIDDFYIFLNSLLILGVILIAFLLFGSEWTYRGVAVSGSLGQNVMGNPLAISEMAGYVMMPAVFLYCQKRIIFWNLFRGFAVFLCLFIAFKSGTRGQFFCMIAVPLLFLPIKFRGSNRYVLFLVLSFLLFMLFVGYAFEFFTFDISRRWDLVRIESDYSGRLFAVSKLLESWFVSPVSIIFGLGNSASYDPDIVGYYPHNVVVEILGEQGLIGFLLFIGIVMSSIINIVNSYVVSRKSPYNLGILCSLSSMFVFSFLLTFKQGSMLKSYFLFSLIILLSKYKYFVCYPEIDCKKF